MDSRTTAMEPSSEEEVEPSHEEEVEPSPEEVETKCEEAESLEQIRARICQLIGPAGQRRVTGDIKQRCLALVEMEIGGIVASLSPSTRRDYVGYKYTMKWLKELIGLAKRIVVESTNSRWHTQLDQAVAYWRHRNPKSLLHLLEEFLIEAEDPLRHMLHPPPVMPPSQSAEAGGVPLVGIDSPVKCLLNWLALCWETSRPSVMAVVGPVGIGKTTLAVELHKRLMKRPMDRGDHCFNFIIMARLSKGVDRFQLLLQEILSQISDPEALPHPPTKIEFLVSCVSDLLGNKRYFICIDDITEAFEWEIIKGAFPNNGLGSRILITSLVGSKAWSCFSDSNVLVHEMKPLNLIDSERLLITRAFGSVDAIRPDSVKQLVDKILMRCDGIPLLINGMAEWLKEKLQLQLQCNQQSEEELDAWVPKQLVSALSSAYNDLPYYLKIPSLYVSMFPYGYKFDRHRLVSMFPYRYKNGKRAVYLSELIHRIIMTRVAETFIRDPDEDEASQWQVNHFMHQFLVYKSAENRGFSFTRDYLESLPASKVPRRLALHNTNSMFLSSALENLRLSEIRSLAISGGVSGISFSEFVNLVELDLEGWEKLTDENLQEVCKSTMFFLQYLSVRDTQITKLPQEIKCLCNLKVLDVCNTQISELPHEVFKLEFLHELDVRGTRISQLPKQIVGLRLTLSVLLLGDEEALDSVETTTKVSDDIRFLSQLETLATIDLSEQPASFVNALGDVTRLRVLAITWSLHQCTDKDYREALLSSMEKWHYLQSLTIHCGLGCSMEFLGPLSNPPKKLEKLRVAAGRFASVPRWIGELRYLSFVQITVCKQKAKDLKVLGGLRRLECLVLGLDFIPSEVVVIENEGFPKLQRLSINCPMPWISFSTGAMWHLTYLQLKFCAIPISRNSVPSGIECLRNLTEVALHYDVGYANSPSVKNTKAAVKEQVANHLNRINLFINGIQDYDVQAADNDEAEMEDGTHLIDEVVVKAANNEIQSTSEIEEVKSDADV